MHRANDYEAYIGLGSNISPEEYLPWALYLLREYTTVLGYSQTWETPPYGLEGANFLNAVVRLITCHSANLLKNLVLRHVEALLGRVRTNNKFISRTIDLDILVFDGNIVEPDVWYRSHLAVPLAEMLPCLIKEPDEITLYEIAQQLREATPDMKPRPEVLFIP